MNHSQINLFRFGTFENEKPAVEYPDFHEFVKAQDTIYFYEKTNHEIKTNEKSIVIAFDYNFMYQSVKSNPRLLFYFTQKTEELLTSLDVLRNFPSGLTSEEYLVARKRHPDTFGVESNFNERN